MSGVADALPLIDHHCHGVAVDPLDRAAFESFLTEADGPGRWHGSLFDTQVGMAIRARCAPLLDLAPFAQPADYLARREELGPAEVARRMLAGTGITDYLVDTGFAPVPLTTPDALASYGGGRAHEIVRLETLAEQLLRTTEPSAFAGAFRSAVADRAASAAGFKSIAAYRTGLELDPRRPSDREVAAAAAALDRSGPIRLVDRTLIRFGIWTALEAGRPLQFHVGYGDADVDLASCDPLLLMPLLRAVTPLGVPVMLLHNYPFHRSAGYLAQVFDTVFVDVGLALHNVGTRADALLAELLELAPFGSALFSSDAFGLPELYAVHAGVFRGALGAFLDDGLRRGAWPAAEAERIAAMICTGNARRAYGLPAS